jgi:hypothetical protein
MGLPCYDDNNFFCVQPAHVETVSQRVGVLARHHLPDNTVHVSTAGAWIVPCICGRPPPALAYKRQTWLRSGLLTDPQLNANLFPVKFIPHGIAFSPFPTLHTSSEMLQGREAGRHRATKYRRRLCTHRLVDTRLKRLVAAGTGSARLTTVSLESFRVEPLRRDIRHLACNILDLMENCTEGESNRGGG